jgi:pilus assembly protein CpaF
MLLLHPGKRVDESNPMVDVSLPDGSRVNVVLPPASPLGASMTIRRYQSRFRDIDLLRQVGTLDTRMESFLISCVLTRRNILVAGSTGSGKTSLLDALAAWIPKRDRIVTIEDTLELRLEQPDIVRLLTRPPNLEGTGEIKLADLFRNTLRMRPDRILLGEIRGPEALDFLQVLNAGVDGSVAVIHASSTHEALLRLEYLVATAGLDIPEEVIRRQIADGLDIVVLVAQLADGSRKILHIAEVTGLDPVAGVTTQDIFRYEVGKRQGDVLDGRFVATGYVPKLHRAFELAGLELDPSLYKEALG